MKNWMCKLIAYAKGSISPFWLQIYRLRCFLWFIPVSLISFWIMESNHTICIPPLSTYPFLLHSNDNQKVEFQLGMIFVWLNPDGHLIGKHRLAILWHGLFNLLAWLRPYLWSSPPCCICSDHVGYSSSSLMILRMIWQLLMSPSSATPTRQLQHHHTFPFVTNWSMNFVQPFRFIQIQNSKQWT